MRPSTFSIVAFEPSTGELGVAVQSKFLSVGAVVPWVASDAGAIATQAWANTSYGADGLAALRSGASARDVLDALVARDPGRERRQAGIVDRHGGTATFTGRECIGAASGLAGPNFVAQGNCLASDDVVRALASGYVAAAGTFADRLVAALEAAQRAGGDKRGQQSAALVVCKAGGGYGGFNDRYVDLRVDDHAAPIGELARLLALHKLCLFEAEPEDLRSVDAALGAELVRELIRVERLPAGHAAYDDAAREALTAFVHTENLENRCRDDGRIDVQTLAYLRGWSA